MSEKKSPSMEEMQEAFVKGGISTEQAPLVGGMGNDQCVDEVQKQFENKPMDK